MTRSLRLRPIYRDDEETGPEVFNRGIAEIIAERRQAEEARRAFQNQVSMAGGRITELPGRRSLGDIWRQRPRVLGGQGGLSRPPTPQRIPTMMGQEELPGEYAEIEGPGGIRARMPNAQYGARMEHQRALEKLREEYRLRGELPRGGSAGRTIDEEKELITHKANEAARTRRPLVGRASDDPNRRRAAWIAARVAERLRAGESADDAAEEAADAWEAMQRTRTRMPRGVGVSIGQPRLDTPENRAARPDAATRARQLAQQGKSREEAARIMRSEGYSVR